MNNVYRLGAIAVLAVLAACGGGSGGGDDENDQPSGAATITVADTVIKVGETKTVTVGTGQLYTLVASEPTTSYSQPHVDGQTCDISFSGTLGTGQTTYKFVLPPGTTQCTLKFGMTGGEATVVLDVP